MKHCLVFSLSIFLTLSSFTSLSALELPGIFSDHMVVQHDQPVQVWGQAAPGASVELTLAESTQKIRADAAGAWRTEMVAPPVGGPYTLRIVSGDEERVFEDVLSGEVWIASGQSNMDWTVQNSDGKKEVLDSAEVPGIRLFKFPRTITHEPAAMADANWALANRGSVIDFSAVAWHFARKLHEETGRPVGLIQSAWGGTYVQAWMPYASLEKFDFMQTALEKYTRGQVDNETFQLPDEAALREALRAHRQLMDPGNRGILSGWQLSHFDDGGWELFPVPGKLEAVAPSTDGAFWVRRSIEIPEDWVGKDLLLSLGPIDDFDHTYFNGYEIGSTGPEVENAHGQPRHYTVPAERVQAGRNLIAIRVFDRYRDGGFMGEAGELTLRPAGSDGRDRIALAGDWRYTFEFRAVDPEGSEVIRRLQPTPNQPAVLYNGMLHPIEPYGIRGAIWYQGESNSGRPEQYAELFPAMIEAWRERWGQGDFPFLYVQLANFKALQTEPAEGGWALIREAQQAALKLPNVGEAVILDVGEADDIHPRDKQTPGHRLAALALAMAHGKDLPHQSPTLAGTTVEGSAMRLRFEHVYGGLETRDGEPPRGFALLGQDGTWRWAEARIEKSDTIVLSHPEIEEPVAARYAWANNPIGNLNSAAGFPMSGFRTDKP